MRNPKFVLKKTSDNQFHFTLQAKNGETVAQSETYTSKQNAIKGIHSVVETCVFFKLIDQLMPNYTEEQYEQETEPLNMDYVNQFIEDLT